MIKTCQSCGAVNGEADNICCFCDAPLGGRARLSTQRQVATQTEDNSAVEPDWRREVSNKLRQYRARRKGLSPQLQTILPFEADAAQQTEQVDESPKTLAPIPAPVKIPRESRKPPREEFEIEIPQKDFAPVTAPVVEGIPADEPLLAVEGLTNTDLYPIASLPERRLAALLDIGLIFFTYGGMLALFTALGGHVGFNKLDLTVAIATLGLFYAQYFALFTVFGGSTPGMMLQGLRVISFKGETPTSRQMLWRSLGYLLSAGACFLGFIWALWDDEKLCWQDRVSHTYLTSNDGNTLS